MPVSDILKKRCERAGVRVTFQTAAEETHDPRNSALLCHARRRRQARRADTAADRVAYEAAADKAGKNAAAHVQLALWCEAHGFTAERIKHLTVAVSLDPSNVLARGLLGLVAFQGKWAKPEQVEQEIQNDPKFQALFREYLDRRVRTPQKRPTPSCGSRPGASKTG